MVFLIPGWFYFCWLDYAREFSTSTSYCEDLWSSICIGLCFKLKFTVFGVIFLRKDILKFQFKLSMQTIMLAIAVSIMVFFFMNSGKKMILGIFLGTFISLLNFRQMALGFEKAVRMEEARAKRYATIQYMIRFFIVGAVLVLSARSPYVNVPGVVIGLFLLKVVILGSNFLKFIFRNSI